MPKSLEINSRGLDFDRFMRTIVKVKAEKPTKKKPKRKRSKD
jgi:hypothetical protein